MSKRTRPHLLTSWAVMLGEVTATEAADIIGVTVRMARRHLEDAVGEGLLRRRERGPAVVYVPREGRTLSRAIGAGRVYLTGVR